MSRSFSKIAQLLAALAAAAAVSACQGQDRFIRLTPDNPVAQIPGGLALTVSPAMLPDGFGVKLTAIPPEALAADAAAAWGPALAELPVHLRLRSPLYSVQTDGPAPAQMFLSLPLPQGTAPEALDVYGWSGQGWTFLPVTRTPGQLVASVSQAPQALAVFEPGPLPPLVLAALEPGQALAAAASEAANGLMLGGVHVQADGGLDGQLPNYSGSTLPLYPVIRNYQAEQIDTAAVSAILGDLGLRANHLHLLAALAASGPYSGLVLDYRGLTAEQAPAYTGLVAELAARLQTHGQQILVVVEPPALNGGRVETGGYDWRALGAASDALLMAAPADPAAAGDGRLEQMLGWAVGEVSRGRLRLLLPAGAVERQGEDYRAVDPDSALAVLGSASALTDTLTLGQAVTLTLTGPASGLDYDEAAAAARLTYRAGDGTRTLWLASTDALRRRLSLAEAYQLGGVAVPDLLAPGLPAEMPAALVEYKVRRLTASQSRPALLWSVFDASGPVVQATAQPGQPYVYTAPAAGDYRISAGLALGGSTLPLGEVTVRVAAAPAAVPDSGSSGGGSGSSGGGGTVFVPPPPAAGGLFELGGQVPGFLAHPGEMKQSGMTWVKFQAIDPAGSIAAGKAAGFKVLISAVGNHSRAADPAYWPEYAAWVAGIAALGADAIEVWNEANLDREWPNGQISGRAYTEMLKQAYTAIKAANPGTLVISGAPAPTGAAGAAGCTAAFCNDDVFIAEMAQAGAANYMDCVGVHYNTGTTSPTATTGSVLSGYHYSYYFWPMVDLYYNAFGGRPLCFTELGYVSPQGYESVPLPAYFQWAANTTVADQAQWLAEAASLSASSGKVRMMIVFNVDFTQYLANDPQAGYAILRPDGSCPACAGLDAVMP